MSELEGLTAVIFVGDDYEDMELQYPKYRLQEAGARVLVAGLEAEVTYHGKHGYPQTSETRVDQLSASEIDLLVIPGGWMPDKLRRDETLKQLVRDVAEAGKPIASICHGPWIDISAGIVSGATCQNARLA